MQGWLNSDGYYYLSIVRRQRVAAVSFLQRFQNHVCDETIFRILHMEWFGNEMVFRIYRYEMISGFHIVYDGVQFLRSFRILDTTLLKNELLCRYFSIIFSRDVEQTFCRKPSSIYFWRFFLTCLLKDTHVSIFWITILAFFPYPWNNVNSIRSSITAEIISHDWWFFNNQWFETF